MWSDGSGACHRPPASGGNTLSVSYPHLHALALQVPEGHPRKSRLFQNPLVQVVELVELIRRSGLGVEEHMAAGFRYPLQEMLRFAAQGQQALSLENVSAADMKIGPRQGDKFTLPQAAGESCVDERKCAQLFRRIQIPLDLAQAQRGCLIGFCLWFPAEPHRVVGNTLVTGRLIHASPQEQMDAPDASGAESLAPQAVIEAGDGLFRQFRQPNSPDSGENVAVDQIAVSAHGAAAPSALVLAEPAVTPPAYGAAVFFLHIVASFRQPNNTTEREK